ncbi:MAG: hypothetical protein D6725_13545 [Planctomycetota bacterium]|nr:MAG: hypothetical protein D6725_13545 [Planctomycetota bacterium]
MPIAGRFVVRTGSDRRTAINLPRRPPPVVGRTRAASRNARAIAPLKRHIASRPILQRSRLSSC